MTHKMFANHWPARTILYSIITLIIIGTTLLLLPGTCYKPLNFMDALFTAVSAITATGLFTIPFEQFTPLGHAFILLLIQIGGIGIITLSFFFISLFMNLTFLNKVTAGELFNISAKYKAEKILFFIIAITIISELIGTLYFTAILARTMPLSSALFAGLFQAVSAFCNAGISLLPNDPLTSYAISVPTTILVFLGGFGFIPLYELLHYLIHLLYKKHYMLSLYTTIIIRTSMTLLLCSTILFWLIEKNHLLDNLTIGSQLLQSIIYCINFKTAGFFETNPAVFQYPTILLMLFITFIGSSPGSMGGGIKISTFAVLTALVKTTILGHQSIVIQQRTISTYQARKAVAIVMLSLSWIMVIAFCLIICEPYLPFDNILFETITASTNLGSSFGIAGKASCTGKLFLIMSMLLGKIGIISFIIAVKTKEYADTSQISYPQEDILLG